jgi:hypothetical protein
LLCDHKLILQFNEIAAIFENMKQIINFLSLFLIMVFFAVTGCTEKKFGIQGKITTDIRIERLEMAVFDIDPAAVGNYISQWEKRYGDFFHHFCQVAGLGDPSDQGFIERANTFITDRNNYRLYKKTMEVFPDLSDLTKQLNEAFSTYTTYFPDMQVPVVYTFISGFSRSAITDSNLLAIGLDRYLGTDEVLYREAGIYNYLTQNMHPKKIASDCMNFWCETEFPFNDSVNNLIATMIYQGRSLYFAKNMLPEQPDTLTLGFRSIDLEYLEKYEKSMWAFLVEHRLLFNTDRFTINKFILEGPFTTDFGRQSPAKAAVWIGYRITENYMKRNPDLTLKDLMQQRDYLKILNGSGYNP